MSHQGKKEQLYVFTEERAKIMLIKHILARLDENWRIALQERTIVIEDECTGKVRTSLG